MAMSSDLGDADPATVSPEVEIVVLTYSEFPRWASDRLVARWQRRVDE